MRKLISARGQMLLCRCAGYCLALYKVVTGKSENEITFTSLYAVEEEKNTTQNMQRNIV